MNNRLVYKGYTATFGVEDDLLIGTVEDIDAVIMFSAESIIDLRSDFERAIDQYVSHCKEQGVEPSKPYRGTFNVRVGPENHRHLALAARRFGLSLNEVVKQAVEEFNARHAVDPEKVAQTGPLVFAVQMTKPHPPYSAGGYDPRSQGEGTIGRPQAPYSKTTH